jgi:hypothetical protein
MNGRNKLMIRVTSFAVVAAIGLFFAPQAFSHTALCKGILPPNDMKIPVGAKVKVSGLYSAQMLGGGLTEAQFNTVLDKVEKINAPLVAQAGGKFEIKRNWTDETVNAYADRDDGNWTINMFGGLARHPLVTEDGFALVACHESGHHLGGAPKISGWMGSDWAADEGAADYYGTLKCLRRYFAGDDNAAIVGKQILDPTVEAKCKASFGGVDDQLVCERASFASQSLANLLAELGKTGTPAVGTPDTNVVSQTYDGHPAAQCRLDTYLAGSFCHVDVSAQLSDTDYHQGSCSQPQDTEGWRPLCWFKP